MPFLDRCQNPNGCRKVAVFTVEAVNTETGDVEESLEACAYCADAFSAPDGYEVRVVT